VSHELIQNDQELKELEKKVKKEKEALDINYKQAKAEADILAAKIKSGNASAKETEEYKKISSYTDEISKALEDKISYFKKGILVFLNNVSSQ
jgi:hypothetical protein